MQQPEKKQILIPQYSLRWLLALPALFAVILPFFGLAVAGKQWAAGISIAIVSLAIVLLVHAAVFGVVWTFSLVTTGFRIGTARHGRSPFRQDAAAPGKPGHVMPASDKETPATPILLE